jgi:hypothetical protein
MESANEAALRATEAKKQGDLLSALEYHSRAAKLYKDVAIVIRDRSSKSDFFCIWSQLSFLFPQIRFVFLKLPVVSLSNSLLLLSQTQARSAIALKGVVQLNPVELRRILPPSTGAASTNTNTSAASLSQKERLRAAVRGALGSKHPHEADLSESQFLGDVKFSSPNQHNKSSTHGDDLTNEQEGTLLTEGQESSNNSANPVDEMMELERELRDMDMVLELGNSISSLDSRMQHRMKASMIDGSFMVVPPGSQSYMASSMWTPGPAPSSSTRQHPPALHTTQGMAGVRARANRVQNILDASTTQANKPSHQQQTPHTTTTTTVVAVHPTTLPKNISGLESSWWGNTSTTTSQILTSSIISLGGRTGIEGGGSGGPVSDVSGGGPTSATHHNTKQIMRLMDSLKTLGDENAALLREVEELESARAESNAARESMKQFKAEYSKRFTLLKKALEKFRQEHPAGPTTATTTTTSGNYHNPVHASDFMKSASVSDQLQRQEQLIRKLTADLKKGKEESKKKDAALRKYESFYREVKARSAQKAAQRQQLETQHQQQLQHRTSTTARPSFGPPRTTTQQPR